MKNRLYHHIGTIVMWVSLTSCGPSMVDLIKEDPCYSLTIHLDTITMTVDSTTWEWTPGLCDYPVQTLYSPTDTAVIKRSGDKL